MNIEALLIVSPSPWLVGRPASALALVGSN